MKSDPQLSQSFARYADGITTAYAEAQAKIDEGDLAGAAAIMDGLVTNQARMAARMRAGVDDLGSNAA